MKVYHGKDIHSNYLVELPIDEDVVKRVKDLAKIEKEPTFDPYPMFEWAPGIPVMDNMTEN